MTFRAVVFVLLAAASMARSTAAWHDLEPDQLGPFEGHATVMGDAQPYGAATRIVVELDGERFEIWAFGRGARTRLHQWQGGDRILVSGTRRELADDRARRVASQHVVGRFDLEWAADRDAGTALARGVNRIRSRIETAAANLPAPDGALFRGLVIGDDRDQPVEMVERFRASGLSHLTAVSGQNVAFVLAAAGPLLRTLSPWARWAATCALIGWFAVLTRLEPSILRAGVMAGFTATAFVVGRPQRSLRTLAVTVIVLVLVDPLLVWSVGFWLSAGATAGVVTAGPWLARRLSVAGPFAMPLGVTLGAQLGVALPSLLVFDRLPLVSVPANLLAVPAAGFVMLYGLPAALVAAAVPGAGSVLMAPAGLCVRWVDTVAVVASAAEPPPPIAAAGWVVIAAAIAVAIARWRGDGAGDRPQSSR